MTFMIALSSPLPRPAVVNFHNLYGQTPSLLKMSVLINEKSLHRYLLNYFEIHLIEISSNDVAVYLQESKYMLVYSFHSLQLISILTGYT